METSSVNHILSFAEVQKSIAESLGITHDEVFTGAKLRDLGDSMDLAQLVLDLEQDYSVEITDDELEHLFTVQDVVNYLNDPRSYHC